MASQTIEKHGTIGHEMTNQLKVAYNSNDIYPGGNILMNRVAREATALALRGYATPP